MSTSLSPKSQLAKNNPNVIIDDLERDPRIHSRGVLRGKMCPFGRDCKTKRCMIFWARFGERVKSEGGYL